MISKRFDIGHLDIINPKIVYPDMEIVKAETYPSYDLGDDARTYIADDKVIFCCGLKMMRQGVVHCWSVPSIYAEDYQVSYVKEVNSFLNEYVEKNNIHRVQTTILPEFTKWIEVLGFKKESTLKAITHDKKDEFLYVKLF